LDNVSEPLPIAFLELALAHGDDATVLTISAPNGGAEIVHELAAAVGGR
jgi:hypothetical protein